MSNIETRSFYRALNSLKSKGVSRGHSTRNSSNCAVQIITQNSCQTSLSVILLNFYTLFYIRHHSDIFVTLRDRGTQPKDNLLVSVSDLAQFITVFNIYTYIVNGSFLMCSHQLQIDNIGNRCFYESFEDKVYFRLFASVFTSIC